MPPLPTSPDRRLRVAGALLRYRDEGRGPAVLLIHGWSLDLDMWAPQVARLSDSFRLVRWDRRGFGLSSGRASLSADVQDTLSLCDELKLDRIACVGMSQGARVALHLCRIAPERLSCVVLDGPPRMLAQDSAHEAADVPLEEYRELVAHGELQTFRRRWASHPLMQLQTGTAEARALLARMAARYSGKDLLLELPVSEDHWECAVAGSLRTPALIITGEHDLLSRVQAADALAEALPLARRASIAAARHLPNLDHPSSYNAVLRAFLAQHTGAPS
ncbi:MAG TPA: alpha/beta hydrolase [Steroidobacteraceae bacterium]|jgi:pimeloyl-[acyl-carrier protein] methyl ester esterase|nr:alpha/beta hydrolase [Steroidobacteraceae bacterium]